MNDSDSCKRSAQQQWDKTMQEEHNDKVFIESPVREEFPSDDIRITFDSDIVGLDDSGVPVSERTPPYEPPPSRETGPEPRLFSRIFSRVWSLVSQGGMR